MRHRLWGLLGLLGLALALTFPKSTIYVEGNGKRHLLTVVVGGFWMKNTLIPLSIAFFDRQGVILRILDMEPCRADPCPVYYPGVVYQGALEVNQGWFRRRGLAEGARVGGEALKRWPQR